MGEPKASISSDNRTMHYSVGAVIEFEGKYVLVERKKIPLGFAGPAGHIDKGDTDLETLFKEIQEETGRQVLDYELLYEEEILDNKCSKGAEVHYWKVYKCEIDGIDLEVEESAAKSIGWYTKEQIQEFDRQGLLEPVWKYWFTKYGILE